MENSDIMVTIPYSEFKSLIAQISRYKVYEEVKAEYEGKIACNVENYEAIINGLDEQLKNEKNDSMFWFRKYNDEHKRCQELEEKLSKEEEEETV